MWIRRQPLAQARMPSMRPHPLNPRAPTAPGARASTAAPSAQVSQVLTAMQTQPPGATGVVQAPEGDTPAVKAARAGGFHESSYELQHGLQVSESEWPDDVTIPGALGDR